MPLTSSHAPISSTSESAPAKGLKIVTAPATIPSTPSRSSIQRARRDRDDTPAMIAQMPSTTSMTPIKRPVAMPGSRDRESAVLRKSVSFRVDVGGRAQFNNKKTKQKQ